MKKVLQFAGIISLALAIIAFILFMATPGVVLKSGNSQYNYPGTTVIFGSKEAITVVGINLGTSETKPSALALIGWIMLLIGLLVECASIVLPLLKVKALEKFSVIFDIAVCVLFVLAGIFAFIVVPTFYAANGVDNVPNGAGIGAGWVIGGILAIAAGAFAILPAAAKFIGGKK